MGNTLTAESLIGVFAAMVVVVTFRRKTNRIIELAVWIGLVWACVVAITHIGNPQARSLTTATAWAAGQIVGMLAGLFGQGAVRWVSDARFAIADWVVLLFGVDLLVLVLVATKRQGDAWLPVTKLREWMVMPGLRAAQPERAPATAMDEINQRIYAWSGPAAVATAVWATLFFIWLRDVEVPIAARGLTNLALRARERWRAEAQSAPLGADVVHISQLAEQVTARKAEAGGRVAEGGTTRRTTRTRTTPISPQQDPRTDKNGSEKHRQGRLAS
jgi:hypothetical protein